MASKKRPPLAWDGIKPLKIKIGLYVGSRYINNLESYDILAGWFRADNKTECSLSFIVKRLD